MSNTSYQAPRLQNFFHAQESCICFYRSVYKPKIFLFLNQNTCCEHQNELSIWDSSFEQQKHMVTVNVLKFQTLFSFCSQIKCLISGLELSKMLPRLANRRDPDQAASEAAWSGSILFVSTFLACNYSQTCLKQAPMEWTKIACLKHVTA